MYWTITEIMRETNLIQRSKIIKQFIKIASKREIKKNLQKKYYFYYLECCKDMKNFNSMFAIISGLDHKTVQRLQATWERVSDKYKNIFEVNKIFILPFLFLCFV
jgi:Rap guanine nucleotide exchange factor 2